MSIPFSVTPSLIRLIDLALTEDLQGGDATTEAIFSGTEQAVARLIAKSSLIVCGLPLLDPLITRMGAKISYEVTINEGEKAVPGDIILTIHGSALELLMLERTLLNFLQHLSGIATHTRRVVQMARGAVRIVDTRKTIPGFRQLAKYAVRVGGGHNHRMNLAGGVMIKDNHIDVAGSIKAAVDRVRQNAPHTLQIEVEVRNEEEVREAIEAGAHILLLDNMSPERMKHITQTYRGQAIFEASGGITEETLQAVATCGVDVISMDALTHTVQAADISMRMEVTAP